MSLKELDTSTNVHTIFNIRFFSIFKNKEKYSSWFGHVDKSDTQCLGFAELLDKYSKSCLI